jgi:hypothetical protein
MVVLFIQVRRYVNLISFLFSVSLVMDFFQFCFQAQLERFVPFMLQCSLGQKYLDRYTSTPKWWPTDLPFSVCLKKPVGMDDVSALDTYYFHNQSIYTYFIHIHATPDLQPRIYDLFSCQI